MARNTPTPTWSSPPNGTLPDSSPIGPWAHALTVTVRSDVEYCRPHLRATDTALSRSATVAGAR